MSKVIKIFAISFIISHVVCSAYTHTISNQTSNRIAVKFIYEGECQSNNRFSPLEIDPDVTRSFETICPLEQIVASVVTGYDNDTMLRSSARWFPSLRQSRASGLAQTPQISHSGTPAEFIPSNPTSRMYRGGGASPAKNSFKGNGTWIMSELNDCYILNGLRMCKFKIEKVK